MIVKISNHWCKILIILIILIIGIIVYNNFYNIDNIAKGTLIDELSSKSGDYVLKSYYIDGGSLSGNATRVSVTDNNTKKTKNIYFNYPENEINMIWVDNDIVEINGMKLNIHKNKYDWRKD